MNTCPNCGLVRGMHGSILPGCMCPWTPQASVVFTPKELDELLNKVRADEREACAKVCDDLADVHEKANQWGSHKTADALAQAIRARGNT